MPRPTAASARYARLLRRHRRSRRSTRSSSRCRRAFISTLTLRALAAGKHVLVEKPAYLRMEDYERAMAARDRAGRVVLVGENDHYKPLAVQLRGLLAGGVHWRDGVRALHDDRQAAEGGRRLAKRRRRWRAAMRFSKKASTGCTGREPRSDASSHRTAIVRRRREKGPDTRAKSMMVAFTYDNGAVGSLYYSREIPSLVPRPSRSRSCSAASGVITFESNGLVLVRHGVTGVRGSCFRVSATSADTGRCIAIFSAPSGRQARRR